MTKDEAKAIFADMRKKMNDAIDKAEKESPKDMEMAEFYKHGTLWLANSDGDKMEITNHNAVELGLWLIRNCWLLKN